MAAVLPHSSILPSAVLDVLVEQGRGDEVEHWERLYSHYRKAEIPENKLHTALDGFDKLPMGRKADAWKPFAREHPRQYAIEVLQFKPNQKLEALGLDPYFIPEIDEFFDSVVKYKHTSLQAANSTGKSHAAAVVAKWGFDNGYKVIILANTKEQIRDIPFAYIRSMHNDALPGSGGVPDPEAPRFRYTHEHVLQGIATEEKGSDQQIAALAGRHFHRVMVIIEEAHGASQAMLNTAERMATGPGDKIIAIWNPVDPACPIAKALKLRFRSGKRKGQPVWNALRINGENHPNVVYADWIDKHCPGGLIINGAISRDYVETQLALAGGNRDSGTYRPAVLGLLPTDHPDKLIKDSWIKAAQERWSGPEREDDYRGKALGGDVAGEGGDISPLWVIDKGRAYIPIIPDGYELQKKYPDIEPGPAWLMCRDPTLFEDLVYAVMNSVPDIQHVGIDDTGFGQVTRAHLSRDRKLHFPTFKEYKRTRESDTRFIQTERDDRASVTGFTFGANPQEPFQHNYENQKSQLLYELAEYLRDGVLDIPPDDILASYGLPPKGDLIEQLRRCVWGTSREKTLIVVDKKGANAPTETMKRQADQMPSTSADMLHGLAIAARVYFKLLTPGTRPIETARELQAEERRRAAKKMNKMFKDRGKRPRGKYPWQRVRRY